MTRRRSLSPEQVHQACAMHQPGKVGYETIGKRLGVPASTIRDAVQLRTAYAAAAVAKLK